MSFSSRSAASRDRLVVDDDGRAQAREGQAARAPDTAAAPGDQRNLPGEVDLHAVRSRDARSSTPA